MPDDLLAAVIVLTHPSLSSDSNNTHAKPPRREDANLVLYSRLRDFAALREIHYVAARIWTCGP
jgi:hypothetical protein